jgi:hypothetical protein
MNKANFRKTEVYHQYLIIPVQCQDSQLWTASWLDEENLLSMPGGTPLDFSFATAEEAIAALKPILDKYAISQPRTLETSGWATG